VKIKTNVAQYVDALVGAWLQGNQSYEQAVQYVGTLDPQSLDAMRGHIALLIYKTMWQYETADPKTSYDRQKLFADVYDIFVSNPENAVWLNLELYSLNPAANV
jgi:hypothetical protein